MKFGFIAKHQGIWPVRWLCEALAVSRNGFHAWLTRPPSARARARSDGIVGAQVKASLVGNDRMYGARRVWHDLLAEGAAYGFIALSNRQFEATAPNQKLIADFTYLLTAEGWLYVAAVIDLFSPCSQLVFERHDGRPAGRGCVDCQSARKRDSLSASKKDPSANADWAPRMDVV